MTRLLPICVAALCIGACASAGAPTAADASGPAEAARTETVDDSGMAANPAEGRAEEEFHVIDVPAVGQTETPAVDSSDDRRICRREMRTGTHRAVRVCRTRAEIERMEQESKETFRDLHESQMRTDQAEQIRRQ